MAQEKSMFDKIKKQNGERFAKTVRAYDNGIFDVPNLDEIIKFAGRDSEPIMNYLVSLKNIKIEEHGVYQEPTELLRQAGYVAFVADTLEKQNKIKPFFAPNEELCTFRDDNRYKNYYIINAIKENVKDIKRENFTNPQREDEYGTSVISIQILKKGGFISIKNRYNHTVNNPDNTFNSNPDNIIPGLSASIKHHFNVDFSSQKEALPNGYMQMGAQILKCNYEVNNTYLGENFYAEDGVVSQIDKSKELMMDHFILDLQTKEIKNPSDEENGFIEALNQEISGDDKKLQVTTNEAGNKCLMVNGEKILELNQGKIVGVNFPNVTEIGDFFLSRNEELKELAMPNVTKIGNCFLYENRELKELSMPNVTEIGNNFLHENKELKELSMPNATSVGGHFLNENKELKELSMPNATKIGDCFLYENRELKELAMPNVTSVGDWFLYYNKGLKELAMPNVTKIGNCFLYENRELKELAMPNVKSIGQYFLELHPQKDKLNPLNKQSVPLTFVKTSAGRS